MDKDQEIKTAMARAFFVAAFADLWEEAANAGEPVSISPSGCDWMNLAPAETDPAALHAADTLHFGLLQRNDTLQLGGDSDLVYLFVRAQKVQERTGTQGDRALTPEMFGHYLAMQAMGHGVGLRDAFGAAVEAAIAVPYIEFGSHSLEKDYSV